jgi:hypothetical protein
LVSSGALVPSARPSCDLRGLAGEDSKLQAITIEGTTPESALALYQALGCFRTDLRDTDDGRRFVDVEFRGGTREIVDMLNAVEDYVTHRHEGPARLALNGHNYTLHAAT